MTSCFIVKKKSRSQKKVFAILFFRRESALSFSDSFELGFDGGLSIQAVVDS